MKPEKMSGGDLDLFERIASGEDETWDDRLRGWLKKASAHIAALEAERDELRDMHSQMCAVSASYQRERDSLYGERDALRERVKALEAENDLLGQQGRGQQHMRRALESRLAAIRQRAGDEAAHKSLWHDMMQAESIGTVYSRFQRLLQYVLGEDGLPRPYTVEGVSNSGSNFEVHPAAGVATEDGRATCPKCSHSIDARGTYARVPEHTAPTAPPEAFTHEKGLDAGALDDAADPTTAEAFAAARCGLEDHYGITEEGRAAFDALSLLKRRMRAMASVLGALLEYDANGRDFGLTRIIDMARAALTDAPPVFTLEEVRTAVFLLTLSQDTADRVASSLAALRRKP